MELLINTKKGILSRMSTGILSLAAIFMLGGCNSDSGTENTNNIPDMNEFSLSFVAMSGALEAACDVELSGYGSEGNYSVGMSDLRFYVSNIAFYDIDGEIIDISLDENDFQLNHEQGFVGLIDLTNSTDGSCNAAGTERTNTVITGLKSNTIVNKVTFDVGVPQAVMKDVIATTSAEDAPTPLNEMYWSWASGYRHFVMNFVIEDDLGAQGAGNIHIGSRGCGDDGLLALENKESCDFVNTAQVVLDNFDVSASEVVIDIDALLTDLTFASSSEETIVPTVSCHSASPEVQPDCGPVFNNFGLNTEDGTADASTNSVFTF